MEMEMEMVDGGIVFIFSSLLAYLGIYLVYYL